MSLSQLQTTDVVNAILGIDESSALAQLRAQKPVLAEQLQAYYRSIFEPLESSASAFALLDRYLVATRVASHTGSGAVVDWYANLASEAGVAEEILARVRDVESSWPDATPLAAAIRHADLLALRPVDARKSDVQALKDAGFRPAGIVSLSQTIAFVAYQVRLIAGLRAIGGLP